MKIADIVVSIIFVLQHQKHHHSSLGSTIHSDGSSVPEGSENASVDQTHSAIFTSHHPFLQKALFRIEKTRMMIGTTLPSNPPSPSPTWTSGQQAIKEYGAVFPKFNFSSPKILSISTLVHIKQLLAGRIMGVAIILAPQMHI